MPLNDLPPLRHPGMIARQLPPPTSKDPDMLSEGPMDPDADKKGPPDKDNQPDVSPAQVKAGVAALRASKGMKPADLVRAIYTAMEAAEGPDEGPGPGAAGPSSMPMGDNPTSY